jgi:hypothetical protein
MTAISWSPDIVQAFRGITTNTATVGFLTKLNIGSDVTLTPDLSMSVPGESTKVSVAAVLDSISWEGGPTDPITLSGVISVGNKHAVGNISSQSLSNAEVIFRFMIYTLDVKERTYFKAFHSGDADVKGYVKTKASGSSGSPFEMYFDNNPAPEPQSPVVLPFGLTIVPKGEEMDVHVATANLQVQVWTWGVAPA